MRPLACVVLLAFFLTSCAGSGTPTPFVDAPLPQLALQAPVSHFVSFNDATVVANYGSSPIVPLFAIPNISTNLGTLAVTFWGTKDATGKITQITEAGISGLANAVHVFFDTSERPIYVHDDSSGYALKFSYDSSTQQTVTQCDPSGNVDGSSQITVSGGSAVAGPASATGSCTLDKTAAIGRAPLVALTGVPTDLSNISSIAKLITAGSYVAGLGFALAAIAKFKGHKDNGTSIPISMPIALLFVAATLLFLPSIFSASGATMFGSYSSTQSADGLASYLPETSILGCASGSASCPFPSPDPTP